MSKSTVLDVQDLVVYYELENEIVKAVNGISFSLEKGKTIGLVGETGAGKTTTALSILGLIPSPPGIIKQGRIEVCGYDMLHQSSEMMERIRGKDVAMIFQDPMTALNPVFTVGEQIAESIRIHEKLSPSEVEQRTGDMLELVGIPRNRMNDYPHQFSGGMKQRVVIAIALACNPHLLIADEPTTALDVTIQAQVLDLMRSLRDKFGTAMIMITHDLGIVAETCDEVAVMYAGRIVEKGDLEAVFNRTMHPYTEGLFNSLPNINNRDEELKPIPGLMADPTNLPTGCAFAPRCQYATEACNASVPEYRELEPGHFVSCSAYGQNDFRIERRQKDDSN